MRGELDAALHNRLVPAPHRAEEQPPLVVPRVQRDHTAAHLLEESARPEQLVSRDTSPDFDRFCMTRFYYVAVFSVCFTETLRYTVIKKVVKCFYDVAVFLVRVLGHVKRVLDKGKERDRTCETCQNHFLSWFDKPAENKGSALATAPKPRTDRGGCEN